MDPKSLEIINFELLSSLKNGMIFIRNKFLLGVIPWGVLFFFLLGINFVLQKNNKYTKFLNRNDESK